MNASKTIPLPFLFQQKNCNRSIEASPIPYQAPTRAGELNSQSHMAGKAVALWLAGWLPRPWPCGWLGPGPLTGWLGRGPLAGWLGPWPVAGWALGQWLAGAWPSGWLAGPWQWVELAPRGRCIAVNRVNTQLFGLNLPAFTVTSQVTARDTWLLSQIIFHIKI